MNINFVRFLCLVPLMCAAKADTADIWDEISGTYKVVASRCYTMTSRGLEPCADHVDVYDCLTVRKETADSAWIDFDSTQTNGHACGAQALPSCGTVRSSTVRTRSRTPAKRAISIACASKLRPMRWS